MLKRTVPYVDYKCRLKKQEYFQNSSPKKQFDLNLNEAVYHLGNGIMVLGRLSIIFLHKKSHFLINTIKC